MYFHWLGSSLTHRLFTNLERPARDKHSCFLRIFVNYDRKKFWLRSQGPPVHGDPAGVPHPPVDRQEHQGDFHSISNHGELLNRRTDVLWTAWRTDMQTDIKGQIGQSVVHTQGNIDRYTDTGTCRCTETYILMNTKTQLSWTDRNRNKNTDTYKYTGRYNRFYRDIQKRHTEKHRLMDTKTQIRSHMYM